MNPKQATYAAHRRTWQQAYRKLYGMPPAVRMGRGPEVVIQTGSKGREEGGAAARPPARAARCY